LKSLKNNKELNILEISSSLKMDRHTVAKYLEILRTRGLVNFSTKGKSKIWSLSDNPFKELLGVNDFISSQVLRVLSNLDYDVSIQSRNYDVIWHNSKSLEGKCYEVFQAKKVPCKNCPSKKVFSTGQAHKEVVVRNGEKKLMISEPIKNDRGEVIAVVELVKNFGGDAS